MSLVEARVRANPVDVPNAGVALSGLPLQIGVPPVPTPYHCRQATGIQPELPEYSSTVDLAVPSASRGVDDDEKS